MRFRHCSLLSCTDKRNWMQSELGPRTGGGGLADWQLVLYLRRSSVCNYYQACSYMYLHRSMQVRTWHASLDIAVDSLHTWKQDRCFAAAAAELDARSSERVDQQYWFLQVVNINDRLYVWGWADLHWVDNRPIVAVAWRLTTGKKPKITQSWDKKAVISVHFQHFASAWLSSRQSARFFHVTVLI